GEYSVPRDEMTVSVAPLKTAICNRVIYAEAAASGQCPLETDPKGAAAKEIISFALEVLKFTNGEDFEADADLDAPEHSPVTALSTNLNLLEESDGETKPVILDYQKVG
ncbi:MAG: hypothetical protein WCH01_19755, partial [Methylococcaceae bacterium]